jgi:hypothetical protein
MMLATCKRLGITPLTPEEFAVEDKRILAEAVGRRTTGNPYYRGSIWSGGPFDLGIYR